MTAAKIMDVIARLTATSDNMLHETGEGIADWNQDSLMRNFARGTVWPSGRLNPSHTALRRGEVLWPERQRSGYEGQHLGGCVLKALRLTLSMWKASNQEKKLERR